MATRSRCLALTLLRKAVFLAFIFAVASCSGGANGTIDAAAIESEITAFVATKLSGAVVSNATCPESQQVKVDDVFECTLVIDDQEVAFAITQTDSGYDYDLAGGVLTQRVIDYERKVASFVLTGEAVDVAVDCGGPSKRNWVFVTEPTSVGCVIDYGDLTRGLRVNIAATAEVDGIEYTQARLDLGAVTSLANGQLADDIGSFVLDCNPPFEDDSATLVLDPGATFECVAVRDLLAVGELKITILDGDGNIIASLI